MTMLDICFENQWHRRRETRDGINKCSTKSRGKLIREDRRRQDILKLPSKYFFSSHALIAATLTTSTQRNYIRAYTSFQNSLRTTLTSPAAVDEALHIYIEESYFDDPSAGNRQRMSNLLAFLSLSCPQLRTKLGLSRRALSGWNKLNPPRSALPLTEGIMLAFAERFRRLGHLDAAVALALQWATYMRGSEVLALTASDIALPGDFRLHHTGDFGGVNIKNAKTGPFQFTTIRSKRTIAILRAYMNRNNSRNSHKMFNLTYRTYNALFKSAASYFGLDSTRFTTHSARIGGAVTDFCEGYSAKTIALIGRWKSFASLERYLRNGRAWLLQIPMTPSTRAQIDAHANRFVQLADSCAEYVQLTSAQNQQRNYCRARGVGIRDKQLSR